jgi:uncharacterized protein YaaQ
MQLLVAIVQDEDANNLQERLASLNLRATRINTVGGFLIRGNVTFLIGVEEERVGDALAALRATCHTRRIFMNPMPPVAEPAHVSLMNPIEVVVGGATVFSFPVRRFLRLRGGGEAAENRWEETAPTPTSREDGPMNLIIAIVQDEDAGPVIQALIGAGHRVTRINTAGGFLRRGNATLLIGVETAKVDEVLRLIQGACRYRPEPSPVSKGMPMYSATVFVLEASNFLRL